MNKNRKDRTRFAVCIADDLPCLQQRKIYKILPDAKADSINWVRVVDDFGEDYLYPGSDFVFVNLPLKARRIMTSTVLPKVPSAAEK